MGFGCGEVQNKSDQTSVPSHPQMPKLEKVEVQKMLNASNASLDSTVKITNIRHALNCSLAWQYSSGIVNSIFTLTAFFFEKGNFDSCVKYYHMAYQYASRPDCRKDALPALYLNHGNFYYLQGNYVKADSLFYIGLRVAGTDSTLAYTRFFLLYNLNFTSALVGQKARSFQYIIQAKQLARHMRDSTNVRLACILESDWFMKHDRIEEGRRSLEESFAAMPKDTTLDQWALYAALLATTPAKQKAIPEYQKAISEATKTRVDFRRLELETELGNLYVQLGNYGKAVEILESVQKENARKNFKVDAANINESLSKAYAQQGNFKKALETENIVHAINDSLLNLDKVKALNELNLRYNTAEKDKLIALDKLKISEQHNQIARQTTWIALASSATLILLAFVLAYSRFKKQEITSMKKQQEIDQLRSRILGEEKERERVARELHDGIGGLLTSALLHTSLLEKETPRMTQSETFYSFKQILTSAAIDLRKTAGNLMPEPVLRLGLSEAIIQYCSSMEKSAGVELKVQAFGSFDSVAMPIQLAIYRITQELVHNAIKHAQAATIWVQLGCSGELVEITVEDNGKGIAENRVNEGSGLKNIQQRVKELKGLFSLTTFPGKGTSIAIELPINQIWHAEK